MYVVHDRTTSAQPGILATAYESVEKAIADLDGFRAQHPDNPGPDNPGPATPAHSTSSRTISTTTFPTVRPFLLCSNAATTSSRENP